MHLCPTLACHPGIGLAVGANITTHGGLGVANLACHPCHTSAWAPATHCVVRLTVARSGWQTSQPDRRAGSAGISAAQGATRVFPRMDSLRLSAAYRTTIGRARAAAREQHMGGSLAARGKTNSCVRMGARSSTASGDRGNRRPLGGQQCCDRMGNTFKGVGRSGRESVMKCECHAAAGVVML